MMVFVFESQYLRFGDVPKSGYNGAVLKTDVLWKTWPVGSNPTVTASNKHFIGKLNKIFLRVM